MSYDYQALVRDDRVHGSLYVEPGVFREEMERIFHRGWVFVAHESEVPSPGDWITRRVGLANFILSRDPGGTLHLLANRCAHRGTALCWEERGHSGAFQCTFHGWTFALDGKLTGVTYPGGFERSKEDLGLDCAGQVDTYRGFLFANVSGGAGPLAEHLGPGGMSLIDRLCALSPSGKLRLAPNWIGQRIDSNWKMWPESDNDGYHLQFLHASMFRAVPGTQYDAAMLGGEYGNTSRAIDHGRGHFELELKSSYGGPLAWLGTTPEAVPEYGAALEAAYGAQEAKRLQMEGPPHAMIFPNLFLGEINLAIVEPLSPDLTVHRHTAIQLDSAGDRVNRRLMRMSEAAMGPASFFLPEDAVTAERMQAGFSGMGAEQAMKGEGPAWIDLSRGRKREMLEPSGARAGRLSDETTNRAFWRHYRHVMSNRNGPESGRATQ